MRSPGKGVKGRAKAAISSQGRYSAFISRGCTPKLKATAKERLMEGPSYSERAIAARREFAAHSSSIGISDAFIDQLVETFYGRIRADATLGLREGN